MGNTNIEKLRVFEAFAGYGSQSIALRNIGVPYEVVAISEIDKYAIKAYEAIHGPTLNLGDISKIDINDIPKHDLFTYSFPCQDLSAAGKQKGLGEGTRSGLLYECEKVIEHCKPKYLLLENVKNLVGKKFKADFDKWLEYLEGLGYTNYWKVLNAKNYGVPQNRERVFVISILEEHKPFEWPTPIPLDKCIKDILEEQIDEKYYLSDELVERFKENINKATDYKQPKQIAEINQVGMLDIKGNEQVRRVYGDNGISPTLNTMQGGNRQPKIITEYIQQEVKVRKYEVDIEGLKKTLKEAKEKAGITIKEIADTLEVNKTTVEHWFRNDNCFSIPDENIWHNLKELLNITTDKFDKALTEFEIKDNEYDMSNRVYHENGISPTLTATGENGAKKIITDFRIRKLTPRECFRLMGMRDSDIDKIQEAGISNSQQYKLAGNSIVVDVLETIFRNLFL